MTADTDLMRRASAHIRQLAAAATPGPWLNLNRGDRVIRVSHPGNADHIALWHPLVANAVADWLEQAAREENCAKAVAHANGATTEGVTLIVTRHALAVARAILGITTQETPDA